jgi:carotenoid cleavage dioxygenase
LVYHAGRLLALVESARPVEIALTPPQQQQQPQPQSTVGPYDFDGRLQHAFTAHPKKCPETGEMLFFCYSVQAKPYCQYAVVDEEGTLIRSVDVGVTAPCMMHDFAFTRNFSVLLDLPLEFKGENMAFGGEAFKFNSKRSSRFAVVPRHGTSAGDVVWFEGSACFMFHVDNAYEEVGPDGVTTIVMSGCRLPQFEMNFGDDALEGQSLYQWRFRMSPPAGAVGDGAAPGSVDNPLVAQERVLLQRAADFPQTNPFVQGKKHRFTYMAGSFSHNGERPSPHGMSKGPLFDSIIKVDHSLVPADRAATEEDGGACSSTVRLSNGVFCGEICFLASDRPGISASELEEDDGFLVTFAHDEVNQSSWLLIFNAQTMDAKPVASFKLPNRVPYGFHSLWVSDAEAASSSKPTPRAKL